MTNHLPFDSTLTPPEELRDADQALDYVADLLARDALKSAAEAADAGRAAEPA